MLLEAAELAQLGVAGQLPVQPLHARVLETSDATDSNNSAHFIAVFAIGTNPTAKVTGVILEDEKVLSTCHIAFGDNTSYPGGKNNSTLHIDVIVLDPTIAIDGEVIMKDGKLLI